MNCSYFKCRVSWFDLYTPLQNHSHNQYNKHIHHSEAFMCPLHFLPPNLVDLSPQATTDPLSVDPDWSVFLVLYKRNQTVCALFCLLFTLCNDFEIHPYYSMNSSFVFIAIIPLYGHTK